MKYNWIITIATLCGILTASTLCAATIMVPSHQPTIQAGINAAQPSDTVLVAEGHYFENIDFHGKNIRVCSEYALDLDMSHIYNTVIDGSASADPDTGSCVVFTSGESRDAILQGFTLTGGTGTSFVFHPQYPPYREGGAIVIENSMPTICNNRITGNSAPAGGNALPGGGGGISAMYDSNPLIRNNVIFRNNASYASGMVLNYSAGEIRNNIIFGNAGGGQYGTAGLMVWESPDGTAIVENNTIVGNVSETSSGGLSVTESSAIIRNNIVWGNRQEIGDQITGIETSVVEYCFSEDLYPGQGNQTVPPQFMADGLVLSTLSPCIDAGRPVASANDMEDLDNPEFPLFPAQGSLRNDVGAYGGPFAMELPATGLEGDFELLTTELDFGENDLGQIVSLPINFQSFSGASIRVTQIDLQYLEGDGLGAEQNIPWSINPFDSGALIINWVPSSAGPLSGTLAIHHDCAFISENPIMIPFSGTAIQVSAAGSLPHKPISLDNYPNPFNPRTTISFSLPEESNVSLDVYDLHGRLIRNLVSGDMAAGVHSIVWNGKNKAGYPVPTGAYFCRLKNGNEELRKSMMLVK